MNFLYLFFQGKPFWRKEWTAPHSPPPSTRLRCKHRSASWRINRISQNWPRFIQTKIPLQKFVSPSSNYVTHFVIFYFASLQAAKKLKKELMEVKMPKWWKITRPPRETVLRCSVKCLDCCWITRLPLSTSQSISWKRKIMRLALHCATDSAGPATA